MNRKKTSSDYNLTGAAKSLPKIQYSPFGAHINLNSPWWTLTTLWNAVRETCRDESPSHIHHFHLCTFLVVFYSGRGSSSTKEFLWGRGKRLLQAQSDFGSLLWCEERLHKDTEVLGGRNCLLPRAWTRNVPLSSLR